RFGGVKWALTRPLVPLVMTVNRPACHDNSVAPGTACSSYWWRPSRRHDVRAIEGVCRMHTDPAVEWSRAMLTRCAVVLALLLGLGPGPGALAQNAAPKPPDPPPKALPPPKPGDPPTPPAGSPDLNPCRPAACGPAPCGPGHRSLRDEDAPGEF